MWVGPQDLFQVREEPTRNMNFRRNRRLMPSLSSAALSSEPSSLAAEQRASPDKNINVSCLNSLHLDGWVCGGTERGACKMQSASPEWGDWPGIA